MRNITLQLINKRQKLIVNEETNILILDEPTNHLDVEAKDELKKAIREYKGSVLLVCHEPEFYRDVVTDIWNCEEWTTKVVQWLSQRQSKL